MPTYNNIGGMVPQGTLGYKSPTMGGALLGMQLGYQRADAERGFAEDDIRMATLKKKLEQDSLDDPLRAAQREAGIAEAGTTVDWNKGGGALETKQQALMNSQLQGKKTGGEIDDAERTRQKKAIIDIVGALEEAGPLDQNKPGDQALWNDLKSNSPVPMPSWPTPQWLKGAQAKRDSYVNDLEHRQKTGQTRFSTDEGARGEGLKQAAAAPYTAARDKTLHGYKMAEIGAQNETKVEVQTLKNQQMEQFKRYDAVLASNVQDMIKTDMRTGGALSPGTIRAAVGLAKLKAEELLKEDGTYDMDKMLAGRGDAAAKARADKRFKDVVSSVLDTIPGFAAAEAASAGQAVKPPSTYSPRQEAGIKAMMEANGASREAVIEDLKKKGKLP